MLANPISKIFVVVLVVGVALLTVSFASRSHAAATADRSYDAIEQLRSQAGAAPDTSYEALERMRAQKNFVGNSPASDYDLVEALRIHSSFTAPASDYDLVEALRTHSSFIRPASDYDLVEALRIHSSFTRPANP